MNTHAYERHRPTVGPDSKEDHGLFFHDKLRGENGAGEIVAHIDDLAQSSATDLVRAMRRSEPHLGTPLDTLLVSEVDVEDFSMRRRVICHSNSFRSFGWKANMKVDFYLEQDEDYKQRADQIIQTLTPMLTRQRMTLSDVWFEENHAPSRTMACSD